MYAYASQLGRFYDNVFAFQCQVDSLERSVQREGQPSAPHRLQLGIAIDGLMGEARSVEQRLEGADTLVSETQSRFRRLTSDFFCRSGTIARALNKPRGYAGDHALLDMYYTDQRAPGGLDRLLDDVAHNTPAVRAVVNRKHYVVDWLGQRLEQNPGSTVVDLACGPCRVERDLLDRERAFGAQFVAADHDPEALAYARRVLGRHADGVRFAEENAISIARRRAYPDSFAGARYIVSLGLFDYLRRNIAVSLLRTLRKGMEPGGELLIGNFAEGNPTQTFMEWASDWRLIYRSAEEFLSMFFEAGFQPEDLTIEREIPRGGLVLMVTAKVQ
jgi:SAM-dependent methyltransferase